MEKEKKCPECTHRIKKRTEEETKLMINRLNRIEGQVRGIRRMVENNAYCPDILIQVSAITAALNSLIKFFYQNISVLVFRKISGKEKMRR